MRRMADLWGRIAQGQRANLIQPFDRQPLRDHAADGQADQKAVAYIQMIQYLFHIPHKTTHRIGRRRAVRRAVAAHLGADQPQAFGQQGQHVVPDMRVGSQRVQKHDRRAVFRSVDQDIQGIIAEVNFHSAGPRRMWAMIWPWSLASLL